MTDFEKLGLFYLGRQLDPATRAPTSELLLYESNDLTTHAVVVGMTGSGKTGLVLDLLEEAAIDGIPVIAVDPKGDLGNLLLTFPGLAGSDFAPWVDPGDAAKQGMPVDQYAEKVAGRWRAGLAEWGMDGARIQRLRDAADFAIYTPGSSAGLPLSILKSLSAPRPEVREDAELFRDRIASTVTGLCGLVGIAAEPMQSREHILLSTLLERAWSAGTDVDLPTLVRQVQSPPVDKIGVLDLESFYPTKDRFALMLALNNLLGAPGSAAWMEGEPLDVASLLATPAGKPRVSVLSIAHLGDAERMFFVTLLLNQLLSFMRAQSGTTSLRAILYMDEIFGYFPPVANPPSKKPLLTLLKQARAFGLGVVLATQNPVDLDYKGLSNAGTWFIGRLQTERDKARIIEGLAASDAGAHLGGVELGALLAKLEARQFLMNNVHAGGPVIFESRFAMSYLRGPLARNEIKRLTDARRGATSAPASTANTPAATTTATTRGATATATGAADRPALPTEIVQLFLPLEAASAGAITYTPMLLGAAKVTYSDPKSKIDFVDVTVVVTPITGEAVPVAWERGQRLAVALEQIPQEPLPTGQFASLPPLAATTKKYAAWTRDLKTYLASAARLSLFQSASTGLVSNPGESEQEFRLRIMHQLRESRDQRVADLKEKYTPRLAQLDEKLRKAEAQVGREQAQATDAKLATVLSFGAALLGAFTGKSVVNQRTIGRASSAIRGANRIAKESGDVAAAAESLETLKARRQELSDELNAEVAELGAKASADEPLEAVVLKPKKTAIDVQLVALAWMPS
ncbi:MAG TPA: DUF87 domain-containing protein [Polyangiaceae bacterium]|jgi:hypothetical protein|nr:DUF87 domain-containing protein [Polyangiaceae bacterium]